MYEKVAIPRNLIVELREDIPVEIEYASELDDIIVRNSGKDGIILTL